MLQCIFFYNWLCINFKFSNFPLGTVDTKCISRSQWCASVGCRESWEKSIGGPDILVLCFKVTYSGSMIGILSFLHGTQLGCTDNVYKCI